jgi:hypothetical protein
MTTPARDPQKTGPRSLLLHLLLHKPSDSTKGAPYDQGTPCSASALGGIRTHNLLIRSYRTMLSYPCSWPGHRHGRVPGRAC